ncbi:MAG: hypothetical protein HYY23_11300 [Verrucomicrobia bacterium]|nr:hypothetical protein [Verrucomicrobiota bacterium]
MRYTFHSLAYSRKWLAGARYPGPSRETNLSEAIIHTFVRLRQIFAANADLASKLEALEKKYDAQFKVVLAIESMNRRLLASAGSGKRAAS